MDSQSGKDLQNEKIRVLIQEGQKLLYESNSDFDQAFSLIINTYSNYIYNLCKAMLFNSNIENLTEDVFQEVILDIRKDIETFKGENVLGWIISISRNKCLNYFRRHNSFKENEIKAYNKRDYIVDSYTNEELRDLKDALFKLNDSHRVILMMRFFHEMTYEEIASILDITPSTLRKRSQRAIERLREIYKVQ